MERRRAHTQQLRLITPMKNLSFAADVARCAPDTSSYGARVEDAGSNMAHDVSCHPLLCLSKKKPKDRVHMSILFGVFPNWLWWQQGTAIWFLFLSFRVAVCEIELVQNLDPYTVAVQYIQHNICSLLHFQWGQENYMMQCHTRLGQAECLKKSSALLLCFHFGLCFVWNQMFLWVNETRLSTIKKRKHLSKENLKICFRRLEICFLLLSHCFEKLLCCLKQSV